jgi:hypothetical protein
LEHSAAIAPQEDSPRYRASNELQRGLYGVAVVLRSPTFNWQIASAGGAVVRAG